MKMASLFNAGLDIVEIFSDEIGTDTLNVKPSKCPLSGSLQCLFVLLGFKFDSGSILNQEPDEITFALQYLLLSCYLECLKSDEKRTFVLFNTFALQNCRFWSFLDHYSKQFAAGNVLSICGPFCFTDLCSLADEEVEATDMNSFF
jgi:hypothetical protein